MSISIGEMDYKLESWATYKRKNNPVIYSCRDWVKGWIKETVWPTMNNLGWHKADVAEYGINYPKKWAIKLIEERLIMHPDIDKTHFVYSYTKGDNGYMDYVQVFYKIIKDKIA